MKIHPQAKCTCSKHGISDRARRAKMAEEMNVKGEEALTDVEEKDPSLHCLTYSNGSSWYNSISWSKDGRLAVLTNSNIYVLTVTNSNIRKKVGISLGLKFESSIVSNLKRCKYDDGGVSAKALLKSDFKQRQAYLLDKTILQREDVSPNIESYCSFKWSPPGCSKDGRCCMATLGVNGSVYIQCIEVITGIWAPCIAVTDSLKQYFLETDWHDIETKNNDGNKCSDSKTKQEHVDLCSVFSKKSHMLFTSVVCWCPVSWYCHHCCTNKNPDNIYYSSYFQTYVKCEHTKLFFVTASLSGLLHVWLITFNLQDKSQSKIERLEGWQTESGWPTSLSWHQSGSADAYLAVGFSNGCINAYHLRISVQNGQYCCECVHTSKIWEEKDMLNVLFTEWISPKDSVLRLVATKGADIVVFKTTKQEDGSLLCLSCELAPSCHTSPITSLQCLSDKYVLTASGGATQYFDIDNESLPFCDNNVLRGFRCLGISAEPNMTMLARVSCASRLLLHQSTFVKQMEVSFLPFMSPEAIAEQLINKTLNLDMVVREYFSVSAAEDFLLPPSLHKYCDEPDTYEKEIKELQIYLYFNQLRYMRQTGLRDTSITREEVSTNMLSMEFDDPVIRKIEQKIELLFFKEMLLKCVQLLESGWLKQSYCGHLTLLLIADWLLQIDTSSDSHELSTKCFTLLQDDDSLKELARLKEDDKKIDGVEQDVIKSETIDDILPENNSESSTADSDVKIGHAQQCSKGVHISHSASSHNFVYRRWSRPREKCPYCDSDTVLNSARSGVCANNHKFPRCRLTLRLLTEASYRTCMGCRKTVANKYLSGELTVDSVLLNIDTCPFCGCAFVECYGL
ncbi:uncharacterized protein LOC130648744 [Hydractinia symbiolongicarpus]|uniref:uncharacterized protein LOC130648744 n=1 Tax=Hydractinia symbiolongicarpus TaxID=13093 RepID=UPI002549FE16|nr:uncharacterized protein LOC130648744 [Hydractinia symbiolongicarpus]